MSVKKSETALAEDWKKKITWNQIFASSSSIFNLYLHFPMFRWLDGFIPVFDYKLDEISSFGSMVL